MPTVGKMHVHATMALGVEVVVVIVMFENGRSRRWRSQPPAASRQPLQLHLSRSKSRDGEMQVIVLPNKNCH